MSQKITISPYNPNWATQFQTLKKVLLKNLQNESVDIQHVGSTSVPGLKAKPIIDLDIIIQKDRLVLKRIIEVLEQLGYKHLGELGITGREAFRRTSATVPKVNPEKEWFKHNLYVCTKGSIGLQNHLNLRDYLLKNPQKVIEYSQLKENLAQQFPNDIDAYIDGKTDFIVSILNEIGMDSKQTKLIEKENKLAS